MTREATLCQNILNALRIFAPISKFRCFHETKQTQHEVGRFFYNLAEFVFEYFCDSRRILATFAKFCLNSLFATWSYRYPNPKQIFSLSLLSKIVCSLCYYLLLGILRRPHSLEREARVAYISTNSLSQPFPKLLTLLGKGLSQGISGDMGYPWSAPVLRDARFNTKIQRDVWLVTPPAPPPPTPLLFATLFQHWLQL